MPLKTNQEYWNETSEKGYLYSHLKDGKPEGLIEQAVGYIYPISLLPLLIVSFIFFSKLSKENNITPFLVGVGIPSLLGITWGIWMLHANQTHLAWIFPPWAVTNIEFIMSIEDWLWYPTCTTIFYILYRKINFSDFNTNRDLAINSIIVLYILYIFTFLYFTALCGIVVTCLFTIPGLLLFIYAKDVINMKKFLYFTVILTIINCIWDWGATSLVHSIDGMSWATQWIFISFNESGQHMQSPVFLDYAKYPWAWILNSPIEITPAFGLSGAMLDYSFFAAAEKFFGKKQNQAIPNYY